MNRDNPTDLPDVSLELSKSSALAVLHERPETDAILLAGRRFASLQKLRSSMADILLEQVLKRPSSDWLAQEPGMHLRFEDTMHFQCIFNAF